MNSQPTSISELTRTPEPGVEDEITLRELRDYLDRQARSYWWDREFIQTTDRWLRAFDRLTGGRFK